MSNDKIKNIKEEITRLQQLSIEGKLTEREKKHS